MIVKIVSPRWKDGCKSGLMDCNWQSEKKTIFSINLFLEYFLITTLRLVKYVETYTERNTYHL